MEAAIDQLIPGQAKADQVAANWELQGQATLSANKFTEHLMN